MSQKKCPIKKKLMAPRVLHGFESIKLYLNAARQNNPCDLSCIFISTENKGKFDSPIHIGCKCLKRL